MLFSRVLHTVPHQIVKISTCKASTSSVQILQHHNNWTAIELRGCLLINWPRLIRNCFANDVEWMIELGSSFFVFFLRSGGLNGCQGLEGQPGCLFLIRLVLCCLNKTSSVITTLLIKKKHYKHKTSVYRWHE